jgi:hypothetical protein
MPNWKKVIVSGSDASLSNLLVDGNVTASIFSGSQFTGSFYGDGSNLSGIVVDDGLPNNGWDFNIDDSTPINDFQTASLVYLIDFNNLPLVGTEAGKIAWIGNTTGTSQLLPASNGVYIIAGDTTAGYITSEGYSGSIVGIGNVMDYSASVDNKWKRTATTGSNIFIGNQTITGSLLVTGSTTQIGNNTLIGNTILSGTLDVSGSTTFKGAHELSGSNTILGNTIMSGSVNISGSTNIEGNTNIKGMLFVSGATDFQNHTITMTGSMFTSGSQVITGSLDIKGNVNVASGSEFYLAGNKLFNYGQFSDTTTQSGSANTAYAKKLNTTDFVHNVLIESGSRIKVLNTGIYNLQFSTQLANTANTNITFDIWLAYTGSNVANSNTQIDVNKSAGQIGRSVAAWNFMLPIKANDYVELMWSCNASTGILAATGSASNPNRPAIPSVIATLTQVG